MVLRNVFDLTGLLNSHSGKAFVFGVLSNSKHHATHIRVGKEQISNGFSRTWKVLFERCMVTYTNEFSVRITNTMNTPEMGKT